MTVIVSSSYTLSSGQVLSANGASLISFQNHGDAIATNFGTMIDNGKGDIVALDADSEPDPWAVFDNEGTFTVSAGGNANAARWPTIDNAGHMTILAAGSAVGCWGDLSDTGQMVVSGAVAAGVDGVGDASSASIGSGGTLSVLGSDGALGVHIYNAVGFTNAGVLLVSGPSATGVDLWSYGAAPIVDNTGSITVLGGDTVGVTLSGGFYVDSGQFNIINAGLISATTAIELSTSNHFVGAAIQNTGRIHGDIDDYGGGETIENSGLIVGDVILAAGGTIASTPTGRIDGVITLLGGDSTLTLGAEDDVIDAVSGSDVIDGGGGANVVTFSGYALSAANFTYKGDNVWELRESGFLDVLTDIGTVNLSRGSVTLGHVETIIAGEVISDTVLFSGDREVVRALGIGSGTTVHEGGVVVALSGGQTAFDVVVGGAEYVDIGAVASSVSVSAGRLLVQGGDVEGATVVSGGRVSVAAAGRLDDVTLRSGGVALIGSGAAVVSATVVGGGEIVLSAGAVLSGALMLSGGSATIVGAQSSRAAADFHGSGGVLTLADASFAGLIRGFSSTGQRIDLRSIGFQSGVTSVSWSQANVHSGVLTITDGAETATLRFGGSHTTSQFDLASDRHGGSLLTVTTAAGLTQGLAGFGVSAATALHRTSTPSPRVSAALVATR